jgi:hypothetical protein
MTEAQLLALGTLALVLMGGVMLHQVALREGAALGLDGTEVAILGAAVSLVASKRLLGR